MSSGHIHGDLSPCGTRWWDSLTNRWTSDFRDITWFDLRDCLEQLPHVAGRAQTPNRLGGLPSIPTMAELQGLLIECGHCRLDPHPITVHKDGISIRFWCCQLVRIVGPLPSGWPADEIAHPWRAALLQHHPHLGQLANAHAAAKAGGSGGGYADMSFSEFVSRAGFPLDIHVP